MANFDSFFPILPSPLGLARWGRMLALGGASEFRRADRVERPARGGRGGGLPMRCGLAGGQVSAAPPTGVMRYAFGVFSAVTRTATGKTIFIQEIARVHGGRLNRKPSARQPALSRRLGR